MYVVECRWMERDGRRMMRKTEKHFKLEMPDDSKRFSMATAMKHGTVIVVVVILSPLPWQR